ncbi:MAG: hypothetical protein QXG76_04520 [Candidatus Bathyarchaeia archaeon]
MLKDLLEEFVYLLRENFGKVSICLSIIFYIAGLLDLTCLGSPFFVLFSYTGTILLTIGFMVTFEMFPAKLKSWRGISIVLLFASALVYTTAMIVLVLDVKIIAAISRVVPIGGTAWQEGPYQDPLGGVHLQLSRPYAWLFSPLLVMGTLFALVSFMILYITSGQ